MVVLRTCLTNQHVEKSEKVIENKLFEFVEIWEVVVKPVEVGGR